MAVPRVCLRPAKHHPSGTAGVSDKATHPVGITHDVSWRDLPSGEQSRLKGMISTSSKPQVDREKDGHDEIDDDD